MRTFPQPGDTVRIRDQRWRVVRARAYGEVTVLDVAAVAAAGQVATFLLPFEACTRLPRAQHARRVRPAEWRRIACRVLAEAQPSPLSILSATTARLSLFPFQLEPVMALVRGLATRFLIADAVGLGKTIQAGLMIAETLARAVDGRVLVVTPAGLRSQWCDELEARFSLTPAQLDAAALARIVPSMPSGGNPWAGEPLAITSIDYVKRPDIIRALEGLVWDLVVLDEAHTLTGHSERTAAAAALASRARAVVMLTATPHSGDDTAFERLCGLGALPGEPAVMIFRRTREAIGIRTGRRSRRLRCTMPAAERRMHGLLDEYAARALRETVRPGGQLAIAVLERRAWSSPASLAISVGRRIALLAGKETVAAQSAQLDLFGPVGADDEPIEELRAPALADVNAELQLLHGILAAAHAAAASATKCRALARLLRRIREPAIVFTQYRDTLATIAATLKDPVVLLHGGLSTSERNAAVRRFTAGDATVLLATDAASEGLNLHHRCRLVINLETPWTPLRLEQRLGRVDRLGQTRPVHAIDLIARGTREDRASERLAGRATQGLAAVSSTRPPELTCDAELECVRIELARRLSVRAATVVSSRPVVTCMRKDGRRRSMSVIAVPFTDLQGALIWTLVIGRVPALEDDCGDDEAIEAASRQWEIRVRDEVHRASRNWALREQNIAGDLRRRRARLAATLLQPGLFDRRAERSAGAQAQILECALAAIERRTAATAHLRLLTATPPHLLVTLVAR